MNTDTKIPILYVEGSDDKTVISNLLLRHGVDTDQGRSQLQIIDVGGANGVLEIMPVAIRANTECPVGFVVDIDIDTARRWIAIRSRISEVEVQPPNNCPADGYLATVPDYRHKFGVWLMPDCKSDGCKLEHLVQTLVPNGDPLWPVALHSAADVARIADEANRQIADEQNKWSYYREVDRVKAEIHTWLAWQRVPGSPLGSAIKNRILGHDSEGARAFLRWLNNLYQFAALQHI